MARSSSTAADLAGSRSDGDGPLINAAVASAPHYESSSSQVQTTTASGGKLPPQNVSAERSLLGSVLIDDEVMVDIADKISAGDF